jgi:hypothetical protein
MLFEYAGKLLAGELAALIGVEDLRRTVVLNGRLQRLNTEARIGE